MPSNPPSGVAPSARHGGTIALNSGGTTPLFAICDATFLSSITLVIPVSVKPVFTLVFRHRQAKKFATKKFSLLDLRGVSETYKT